MEETWKSISGFEGEYEVSSKGRVKSFLVNKDGRLLSPSTHKTGYLKYSLRIGHKKMKTYLAHRLVAEAFLENSNNYRVVHHKDSDRTNNSVENLEWCTYSDNTMYAREDGRFHQVFTSENNPHRRLDDDKIKLIKELYASGLKQKDVAKIVGCSRPYISEIVNNKKRATS